MFQWRTFMDMFNEALISTSSKVEIMLQLTTQLLAQSYATYGQYTWGLLNLTMATINILAAGSQVNKLGPYMWSGLN